MLRSLILVLAVSVAFTAAELYSDQYDDIDVEGILADDVRREQFYNCFMDTGECMTPAATYFKGNFPEAIVTKCVKCTEKQKEMLTKIVDWYTANQEAKWNALVAKFMEDAKKLKLVGAR